MSLVEKLPCMFTQGRKYCSFIHSFGQLWGRPYVRLIIPWFLFVKYGNQIQKPDILLGPTLLFYQFIVLFSTEKYDIRYNKYVI